MNSHVLEQLTPACEFLFTFVALVAFLGAASTSVSNSVSPGVVDLAADVRLGQAIVCR